MVLAWLVIVAGNVVLTVAGLMLTGQGTLAKVGEFAVMMVFWTAIMSVLAAVILGGVFVPVLVAVRALAGRWTPAWMFGLVGGAALPVAFVTFVTIFRVFDQQVPSVWDAPGFYLGRPLQTTSVALPLLAGGIVCGVSLARRQERRGAGIGEIAERAR